MFVYTYTNLGPYLLLHRTKGNKDHHTACCVTYEPRSIDTMTTVLQPTHSADYDVVPGTVYIVDQTSDADGSAHVRLIPKPSQDLRDPLRWSTWRKYYHLSLLVAYSAVIGAITQWESPVYLVLTVVFKTDISTLNVGRALLILMLGIGNVFLTPFSSSK